MFVGLKGLDLMNLYRLPEGERFKQMMAGVCNVRDVFLLLRERSCCNVWQRGEGRTIIFFSAVLMTLENFKHG